MGALQWAPLYFSGLSAPCPQLNYLCYLCSHEVCKMTQIYADRYTTFPVTLRTLRRLVPHYKLFRAATRSAPLPYFNLVRSVKRHIHIPPYLSPPIHRARVPFHSTELNHIISTCIRLVQT